MGVGGMWACVEARVEIVGLAGDAPGNDNEVLNEEWIQIRNRGDGPVDLTGWTIRDELASNRFSFPAAFILASAQTATIFSGCGENFSTGLYWCSQGSAIWNNDGDTAFLADPNGNIHDTYNYVPRSTSTTTSSTPASTATTTTPATTTTSGSGNCDPAYPTVCIPPPPLISTVEIPRGQLPSPSLRSARVRRK